MDDPAQPARVDKWLWAARFFKTRGLAQQAVAGGRVRVNGERVKPAKELKAGDELIIHIGELEWLVTVCGLSSRRGPASAAQQLYREDEASRLRRFEQVAARRVQPHPGADMRGRPTKRDRRRIERFTRDY